MEVFGKVVLRWYFGLMKNYPKSHFGSGWVTGLAGVILGALSLMAVMCLHYPALLSSPFLAPLYALVNYRLMIQVALAIAFVCSLVSLRLREQKLLGGIGILFCGLAMLIGGAATPLNFDLKAPVYISLDWFILSFLASLMFLAPIERLRPAKSEQKFFREDWWTDFIFFFSNTIFEQLLLFLTTFPATAFLYPLVNKDLQAWVGSQNFILQYLVIFFSVDFLTYWGHRAFHAVPKLWHIHAVHHSSEKMDWLAGGRFHFLDFSFNRAMVYIPIYLLGFDLKVIAAYLLTIAFIVTFNHANVKTDGGWLGYIISMPHFHHWHHADDDRAIDKNFGVYSPIFDRIFKTYYAPKGIWPTAYGIKEKLSKNFFHLTFGQLFRRK